MAGAIQTEERFATRSRLRWAAALLLLAACSHTSPYYRDVFQVEGTPDAAVAQRLLLIGDAGDPDPAGEQVLHALSDRARELPRRTTVVFLGDNVYETGMPDDSPLEGTVIEDILDGVLLNLYESRQEAERRVNAQVDVVRDSPARAIFVPGNHDWDQFGVGGWERVMALEAYLEAVAAETGAAVQLLPQGGCPGPVRVPLGRVADLLVLDTQWWLEEGVGEKPTAEYNPTGCRATSEEAVKAELREALLAARRAGRFTVVAAHHPLQTHGPHGGFYEATTHLFPLRMLGSYVPFFVRWLPLPGIGSLMVGVRGCCSPNAQDLPGPGNRHLRRNLIEAMEEAAREGAAPLVYAAGHEHSLQVFESPAGPRYSIVSGLGSASKASGVGHGRHTLFAHSNDEHPGFVQLDFLRDGRVRLAVVEVAPDAPLGTEVHSRFLVPEPAEHASH